MAEIRKTKMSIGAYFAIEHGGDFPCFFLFSLSQYVPRAHRLRQPQVEVLEQLWSCLSVTTQFSQHQGMERVVNRRSDLCRDDPVSLRIHQKNTSRRTQSPQVFGNSRLLRAACKSIFSFHLGSEIGRFLQPIDMIVDRIA